MENNFNTKDCITAVQHYTDEHGKEDAPPFQRHGSCTLRRRSFHPRLTSSPAVQGRNRVTRTRIAPYGDK